MTRQSFRAHADAYGVRVEVRIEAAPTATAQELARALQIATDTARAAHEAASEA